MSSIGIYTSALELTKTDPEGDFVEAIGRNFTVEQASRVINDHVADWKGKIDKSA